MLGKRWGMSQYNVVVKSAARGELTPITPSEEIKSIDAER
jgi:hypothetical protein